MSGTCICLPGFKGDNCETSDCLEPNCSNNGACVDGQCWCKMGWRGVNCSEIDTRFNKFFPDCSSKGVYDLDLEKCVCFNGWLGDDCSIGNLIFLFLSATFAIIVLTPNLPSIFSQQSAI